MKTLLLTILTLSACASRPVPYTETQSPEVKTYTDSLRCQVKLFRETEKNLASLSEFRVYRRPEVSKLVQALKYEMLACTRNKSELEQAIDDIASE